MDPRTIVEDGYDRIAERHAEWAQRTRTAERERYADILLAHLPAGASVLELRCGVGVPTTRKLATRCRVTGVELSRRHVEIGRRNVPGATFIYADMRTVTLRPVTSRESTRFTRSSTFRGRTMPRCSEGSRSGCGRTASFLVPSGRQTRARATNKTGWRADVLEQLRAGDDNRARQVFRSCGGMGTN
jgi:hypothetical protein